MAGFATESGFTLICPTTGIAYTPSWARIEVIDGERYVQSRCTWCDAKGYSRTDREFNPSLPQIHTHAIDRRETQ
jgi:hypothetical protein